MARFTRAVRAVSKCVQPISGVDKSRIMGTDYTALIAQDFLDEAILILDSTTVKLHQHASRLKKEAAMKKPGEAGSVITKPHEVTDRLGNLLRFLPSNRNRNGICIAQALLEPFDLRGKLILADKEYDSNKFVLWIERQDGIVVIFDRITAKHHRNTDWYMYKEYHLVENLFPKLKNNCRFATRYEKEILYFHAVVCLASIPAWLL